MNPRERGMPAMIPLEQVAIPRRETTDKATRKMIAQIASTLGQRFPLKMGGDSVEFRSMRFVDIENPQDADQRLKASIRVTSPELTISPGAPLEVISGMCMFGASGLTGISATGQEISLTDPLEEIPAGFIAQKCRELDCLHPSEVETTLRLTRALDLLTKVQQPGSVPLNLRFHMPEPEYKLYMIDKLQKGQITPGLFGELTDRITRRAKGLAAVVRKRVAMPVKLESPLDPLKNLIDRKGGEMTFSECFMTLSRDPLMHLILQELKPHSFQDLCQLSYVAEYFRVSHDAEFRKGSALAVEIAEEQPIFDHAKKLADSSGLLFKMAAMFVPPKVLSERPRHGKQELFMHEPNGVSPLSEVIFVLRTILGGMK